jgi:hypothetical protein
MGLPAWAVVDGFHQTTKTLFVAGIVRLGEGPINQLGPSHSCKFLLLNRQL